MPPRPKLLLPTAAAALCALAFAGPASADSISFLRGGDIWVAAPDGTQQTQITHDGGYSHQSQADDGTFIALKGRRLHKVDRAGKLLADFDTPVSGERADNTSSYFGGPFDPEISPDGATVAYEYHYTAIENDPTCFPVGSPNCQDAEHYAGIGYTHSDRQTGWEEPGLGRQSGWLDPSWIGNTQVLLSDKTKRPNLDAMIDTMGDGNENIAGWFEDTERWYLREAELTRAGDKIAFLSTIPRGASDPGWGREDDSITIYRTNGAAPALPEQCFSFGIAEGTYRSPTWSPDGNRIAWEDYNSAAGNEFQRIVVGEVPSQAGGCAQPAGGGNVVIDHAAQPDWGPADPAVAAQAPPPPPPVVPAPKAKPQQLTLKLSKTTLAKALRKGLTVRVAVTGAGKLSGKATRGTGKRVVAKGSAKVKKAGTASLKLKFTKQAKRSLRKVKKADLTVRVAFTAKGAKSAKSSSVKVTLKR